MITLFGFEMPMWALLIIGIIGTLLVWKVIKFAIMILIVLVILFVILFGLDATGIFEKLQSIISAII